jgi:hypothetical protein
MRILIVSVGRGPIRGFTKQALPEGAELTVGSRTSGPRKLPPMARDETCCAPSVGVRFLTDDHHNPPGAGDADDPRTLRFAGFSGTE